MQRNILFTIDFKKLNLGREQYLTPRGRILDTINDLLFIEKCSNSPEIKNLKRELWNSIAQELGLGEKFFGPKTGYNPRATEWFRQFDSYYKTRGIFATFSQGEEHRISNYSLDYFNPDLKLIIEWDEEQHYKNGKLTEKDIKRQKKIQRILRDFAFLRIREKDFDDQQFRILDQKGCKWLRKQPYLEVINEINSIAKKSSS